MTLATVIPPIFMENGYVCLAVAVDEPEGRVEYIGRVPLTEILTLTTAAQRKARLVAAVKAVRGASLKQVKAPPVSFTGTVDV